MNSREQTRARLKKGNAPFLVATFSVALLLYGFTMFSGWVFFAGLMGMIIAYVWVNFNYVFRA